jgi:ectoine hydrolase
MRDDLALPFTREEYADRLARARRAMEAAGIEVLLVTDPANMAWLTGYDAWSFYVHQGVVVSLDDDPVWWGRAIDVATADRTVHLDADHVVGYPEALVQAADRHPMEHLGRLLHDRGHGRRRLGVELDGPYYTAAAHRALTSTLGGADPVDATGLVGWQRAVKSPREIEYLRVAGRIVEAVHARVREVARPGLRKNELVAEIYRAGLVGVDGHGGDYPAIVPLVPSGADAAAPHLTWDDRPIPRGVATSLELAGCHRRYHVPVSRTFHAGPPPAAVVDAERALVDALDAGIDAARAGNRARDVADALFGALARAGIERDGRCGYPVGLAYPPDWGERTISLRRTDDTVLQAGMTFHVMPGLWMDGWGLEITDTILVTDDGPPELLATVPREVFVVG